MGKIPVLLLTFKRPDTTRQVIKAIRFYQPQRMYIASDGPRLDKTGEKEKVNLTRKVVIQSIDWPCEIKTLFQENNLGCRTGVSTAIDWFFGNEEEGIILEDDCVPDSAFFDYVENLIEEYRNDTRIMSISGHNFDFDKYVPFPIFSRYTFSHYHHCWGWATWKRAWKLYDRDMTNWPKLRGSDWLLTIGDNNIFFQNYWDSIFEKSYQNKIDSWAYRWMFSCWTNHGLSILPSKNLIENIGFDKNASHTHSKKNKYYWLDRQFNLVYFMGSHTTRDGIDTKILDLLIGKSWFGITLVKTLKQKSIRLFTGLCALLSQIVTLFIGRRL